MDEVLPYLRSFSTSHARNDIDKAEFCKGSNYYFFKIISLAVPSCSSLLLLPFRFNLPFSSHGQLAMPSSLPHLAPRLHPAYYLCGVDKRACVLHSLGARHHRVCRVSRRADPQPIFSRCSSSSRIIIAKYITKEPFSFSKNLYYYYHRGRD